MPEPNFEIISIESLSERPHPRELAREAIQNYRRPKPVDHLTQRMIDGEPAENAKREPIGWLRRYYLS